MKLFITLLAILSFIDARAQDTIKTKELQERVSQLERRIQILESKVYSMDVSPESKRMQKIARQRVTDDYDKYKPEDIALVEKLYLNASPNITTEESKAIYRRIVSDYPQLNRAGCAQLYLAQQETGPEQERLLKDCIKRFSNCYYMDGAQVGPYAMWMLGTYYQQLGEKDKAQDLFARIRKNYPEAVNHEGELLVSLL